MASLPLTLCCSDIMPYRSLIHTPAKMSHSPVSPPVTITALPFILSDSPSPSQTDHITSPLSHMYDLSAPPSSTPQFTNDHIAPKTVQSATTPTTPPQFNGIFSSHDGDVLGRSQTSLKARPQCVDLARIYYHSLHTLSAEPFSMPQWMRKHSSFVAVISEVKIRAQQRKLTTGSDAMLYAVGECFAPLEQQLESCCPIALIHTMLCLPVTTRLRRRTKDVLLDLLITASAQHTALIISDGRAGVALFDGLSSLLSTFYTSQLAVASTAAGQRLLRAAGRAEGYPALDDSHQTILILQVLANVARQPRNHGKLLAHRRLVAVVAQMAQHSLLAEQMLTLCWMFISRVPGFVAAAQAIVPHNGLVESVVSVVEQYGCAHLTSLIAPFYIPKQPTVAFARCLVVMMYHFVIGGVRDYDIGNVRRAANVVRHLLAKLVMCTPISVYKMRHPTMVESPKESETLTSTQILTPVELRRRAGLFDVEVVARIALALVQRYLPVVVNDRRFVGVLVRASRHTVAGTAVREALRVMQRGQSLIRFSPEVGHLLDNARQVDAMVLDNELALDV